MCYALHFRGMNCMTIGVYEPQNQLGFARKGAFQEAISICGTYLWQRWPLPRP